MMKVNKINLRVYGLLIEDRRILLTDEIRLGIRMTKFPGGGLIPGEGTVDCLKRECLEELGQEVSVLRHFYTTDYFQPTELLPEVQQLISIYYFIAAEKPYRFQVTQKKFDFTVEEEGAQSFRWAAIDGFDIAELNFPVDRKVMQLLQSGQYL